MSRPVSSRLSRHGHKQSNTGQVHASRWHAICCTIYIYITIISITNRVPLVRCASIPLFCPSRHIVQWGMGGGHCFFPFGFSSKSTCPGGFLCVITSPPRCGVAEKGTACSRSTASASSVLSFDVRFLSRRGIARGIQPRLELGIRKAHRGRPEVVCVVAISRFSGH